MQQKDTCKRKNYLQEVLNYICALVPNNVKGENLKDWYKVLPKEFYEPCKISYCNASLVDCKISF